MIIKIYMGYFDCNSCQNEFIKPDISSECTQCKSPICIKCYKCCTTCDECQI